MKNYIYLLGLCMLTTMFSCGDDDDSGTTLITGCTNPNAENYNPDANSDDGSCIIMGCTNPLADNYNAEATTDDGSCIISGCTDPLAENYNEDANTDDMSCIYPRDKWLGVWDLELACTNAIIITALEGQTFTMEVVPSENDVRFVQLRLVNDLIQGDPEDVEVNGNVLEYNPPQITIPFNGTELTTEVGITLILQSDEVSMGGNMVITIFDVPFVGTLTDNCEITGVKQ